jgi:hypothetical protein
LLSIGHAILFCEAELTLLLLFWKRRKWVNVEFCWGHAPRPPGSASPRFVQAIVFCEAELTLFASFSGKRRNGLTKSFADEDSGLVVGGEFS